MRLYIYGILYVLETLMLHLSQMTQIIEIKLSMDLYMLNKLKDCKGAMLSKYFTHFSDFIELYI